MHLPLQLLVAITVLAAPVPRRGPEVFLVQESSRPRVLDMQGRLREELPERSTNASLAPGGRWVAYMQFGVQEQAGDPTPSIVVVRSLTDGSPHTLTPAFGQVGRSGSQFIWSRDGRRVLIVESGPPVIGVSAAGRAYRVYDLDSKKTTDVPINSPAPADTWVTDWSADGKRLLGQVGLRVAWLAFDGKSPPEFVTHEGESAYGGRLSPDGTRVLYKSKVDGIKQKWADYQLFVRDLRTGARTRITPDNGIPDSFCWSPEGKRIAYTLREAFEKPQDANECETRLFTDDPAGGDRRLVTARKLTGKGQAGAIHFLVNDWR
jgi:Tol biopolymer transport system component